MLEFLKILAYTILGIVAFCLVCMFGILIIIVSGPLLLVAFPWAFIIYVMILLNRNQKTKKE